MYQIDDLNLVKEMEKSYLEYSLSVIIGRAIPDVRDGLKPVHRRILYAMDNIGCLWNKSYKKSARIVGDVIGKYHPHGDSAVYDALVRMSQSFNMYTPLVDGQGNFGSIDGDNAAAMRYTEARMSKISSYFLADIDKNTVDFQGNYDNALSEPVVLPSRVPNILLNGASGIAVGMATNIPPHNLGEILDGLIYLIDNPECSIDELIEHIPAPDFPTGGDIVGGEIKSAYRTGKGNVVIRGKTEKEEISAQRERLVIKEIPFNLNKEKLVTKIAELVENNKIEGISDLRDESDRTGIRIAIDLKKNVNSDVICNKLYKLTQLENTFSINMLVVNQGQPQLMNLKDILSTFYDFRKEIIVRRTKFELDKAKKRLHILDGLLKALDNIDKIVKLIKQAQDTPTAKENLIQQFGFSETQSKSILEMRLQNLTNLEKDKIVNEHEMLQKNVRWFLKILNDEEVLNQVIKEELEEVRDNFSCDRRSDIVKNVNVGITDKEMYPNDEMIITYTRNGYIKRVPASEYRTQIKGGKGSNNINKNVDDTITHVLPTTNHKFVFIFTNMGRMFKKYVFELPCKGKNNKGVHIANIIKLKENEKVATFTIMEEESLKSEDNYLFFVTEKGRVKKLCFSEFTNVRNSGKSATKIKEGDRLLNVNKVTNDDEVMLVGDNGKGIRFRVDTILPKSNLAIGVHGMRFKNPQGRIISSSVITADKDRLFMVAQNGFGKKSWMTEYKTQARGGQGTTIMKLDKKTGNILNAFPVNEEEEIIVSTKAGKIIKFQAKEIRETARMTKGIRIIRLENGDEVHTADTVSFDT